MFLEFLYGLLGLALLISVGIFWWCCTRCIWCRLILKHQKRKRKKEKARKELEMETHVPEDDEDELPPEVLYRNAQVYRGQPQVFFTSVDPHPQQYPYTYGQQQEMTQPFTHYNQYNHYNNQPQRFTSRKFPQENNNAYQAQGFTSNDQYNYYNGHSQQRFSRSNNTNGQYNQSVQQQPQRFRSKGQFNYYNGQSQPGYGVSDNQAVYY